MEIGKEKKQMDRGRNKVLFLHVASFVSPPFVCVPVSPTHPSNQHGVGGAYHCLQDSGHVLQHFLGLLHGRALHRDGHGANSAG